RRIERAGSARLGQHGTRVVEQLSHRPALRATGDQASAHDAVVHDQGQTRIDVLRATDGAYVSVRDDQETVWEALASGGPQLFRADLQHVLGCDLGCGRHATEVRLSIAARDRNGRKQEPGARREREGRAHGVTTLPRETT